MLTIGCHLSNSKGYVNMCKEALSIDANTFQFFTRNPRGGQAKAIDPEDAARCREMMAEHQFGKILAHAPYTLNPCAEKQYVREFTWNTMADDLVRMESTPGNLYNFHPGCHVSQGVDIGIEKTADTVNTILEQSKKTTVLIETMAGKGTEIGKTFEEIQRIIEKVKNKARVGVCLDTCHVHDGGYNISQDVYGVLEEFDKIIGFDRLKAIHLNDSKNVLGAHKDRHEKIGDGSLTIDGIIEIITHPVVKKLPICLETPNDIDGYAKEIKLLQEAVANR